MWDNEEQGRPHWCLTSQRMVRPKRPNSEKLICNIDVSAFAAIMVVLVGLFIMLTRPDPRRGVSADLPTVSHGLPMRKALREDAMTAIVMRTGDVFFGNSLEMTKSRPDQLPAQILELMHGGAEPKVYIRADAHAKYGHVREVLDSVRSAGVENVGFLVNERKAVTPNR